MWKIKICVVLLGVVCLGWAFQERTLTVFKQEPRNVELATVERRAGDKSISLNIGGHTALYGLMFYNPAHGEDMNNPGSETRVAYVYYPIISSSHPYQESLKKLEGIYGSRDKVEYKNYPSLNSCAVLVKTARYKKFGEIPDGWRSETALRGMVVNGIETDFNRNIIKKHFPQINQEKLLIIEENRTPTPIIIVAGAVVLGILLILAGLAWLYAGRKAHA